MKVVKAGPRPGEMQTLCSVCNSTVTEGVKIHSCRICKPWHNVCNDCASGANDTILAIKSVSEATPVDLKLADAMVDRNTVSEDDLTGMIDGDGDGGSEGGVKGSGEDISIAGYVTQLGSAAKANALATTAKIALNDMLRLGSYSLGGHSLAGCKVDEVEAKQRYGHSVKFRLTVNDMEPADLNYAAQSDFKTAIGESLEQNPDQVRVVMMGKGKVDDSQPPSPHHAN